MTVLTTRPTRGRPRLSVRTQSTLLSIAGLVTVFVLWQLCGSFAHWLPGIGKTVRTLPAFLGDSLTWQAVRATWLRVLSGLTVGLVLGIVLALVMWKSRFWGRVVHAYTSAFRSVPSTVTALIAVFVFSNAQVGAVGVLVVTVFPFVALVVHGGLNRIDQGLAEMGATYRFTLRQRTTAVVLPQIVGSIMTALRNEHAHAWKVVVVAELFLVPSGMGFEFNGAFSRFDLVAVMHWLILFAMILLASEYLVIRPVESRVNRWRTNG